MSWPRRPLDRLRGSVGARRSVEVFERLVLLLIVVNTAVVVLGTVDSLAARYGRTFRAIEHIAVAAFTVEFVVRVGWRLLRPPAERGRLARLADPHLAIDLLAILPVYAGLARGADGLGSSSLVRVLRLFKVARYFDGLAVIGRVVRRKRTVLAASVFWTALLWLLAASSIYFAESAAQPEAFASIPEALWWAGITMTTVGYGDVYPITPLGRLLGVLISLLGVGIAAVPSSILVSGFLEEMRPERETCPNCGEEIDD